MNRNSNATPGELSPVPPSVPINAPLTPPVKSNAVIFVIVNSVVDLASNLMVA